MKNMKCRWRFNARHAIKNVGLIISFISLFLITSVASAQSWDGRPDSAGANWNNFFDNFNAVESDDEPGSAASTITALDSTTWKIRKPVGRKRAEASRAKGWAPIQGEKYYIKWSWRARSTPNLNTDVTVFQWKTDDGGNISSNKQNYPFTMEYDGTHLKLTAFAPGSPDYRAPPSVASRGTVIWDKAVAENTWLSLVIGVKVSTDSNVGTLEVWCNGALQTLNTGGTIRNHRTFDGAMVYPKWGVYNAASKTFDVEVEEKNLLINKTRP